ncbi:MAG: PKD domain-containing protein [Thermoleophilaceae bacterium]|nr:PKD domain-containing protein [Thermoleophilaceae bacterium]
MRCLTALATTAALLAPAAAASAEPGVSVELPERTVFLSADELAADADVPATEYTLRAEGGQATRETHAGISLGRLVALAGGNPDVVAGVTVSAGDRESYLPGADLADPPPFPEGPALVWVEGDVTGYLRPVRDDADVNSGDRLTSEPGASLTVAVQTGALLEVTAGSDRERVAPRKPVGFWASALGGEGGEQLTYRWRFGDGTTATGQEVRHAYRRPGRYRASVSVIGDGRSGGTSEAVTITVGKPPAEAAGDGRGGGGGGKDEGTASGAFDGGSGSTGAKAGPGSTRPKARPRAAPEPTAPGRRVSGRLLDEAATAAPPALGAATGTAGAVKAAGGEAPGALPLAGIAAIGLLAAGALLELRPRRRTHPA